MTCTEINDDTCNTCTSGEVGCPLLCGATGLCQGIVIHFEDASSTYNCQETCTSFSGCNFYSYDPATKECFLFETCPTVDDTSCQGCISGTPGCEVEEEEGIFVIVVGGSNFDDGYLYDVELVSLDPITSPVPDCLTQLNPFPIPSYGSAGANDYLGTPYFCGGYTGSGNYNDICHKYVAASDEWVESGNMTEPRAYSGYGSSESWGLVMVGGGDPLPTFQPLNKQTMEKLLEIYLT